MSTGLYGIVNSNRSKDAHWGKNCFNSSFPAALANYMMTKDIKAIYIRLNEKLQVVADTISIRDVFNCGSRTPEDLYFAFESTYEPYQEFSFDNIDCIDLVIKDKWGAYLSPLEVKLTVLPTDATSHKPEVEWGCELVVRSATTSYCALGMFNELRNKAKDIRQIFEPACSSIQSWDNDFEMCHKTPSLCACVNDFQRAYYRYQKPLLMQTIWKTVGKTPSLASQAFDIVVWSDYAFSRLFVDSSSEVQKKMSRPMRATARLARCLWELSKSGKIRQKDIYRQMAFDNQTDKEFAIGGQKWRQYVKGNRIVRPILPSEVVHDILDAEAFSKLSPERRFDQTLYFTMNK